MGEGILLSFCDGQNPKRIRFDREATCGRSRFGTLAGAGPGFRRKIYGIRFVRAYSA